MRIVAFSSCDKMAMLYGFAGDSDKVAVWLAVLPFLLCILVASFMLSGQEQFTEEEEL